MRSSAIRYCSRASARRPSSCKARPSESRAAERSGSRASTRSQQGIAAAGLVHFAVEVGEPFPDRRGCRLELHSPFQPGKGFGEVALLLEEQPDVGVGQRQLGVEPQRFPVGGPGLIEPVERPQDVAQVIVHLSRARVQPNGFLAVRESFFCLFEDEEGLAQIRLGRGVRWLELDGASELLQGFLGLAQLAESNPQVVDGDDEARSQLDGATERLDGLGGPFERSQGSAETKQGLWVIRPEPERRPATLHGPHVISGGPVRFGEVAMEEISIRLESDGLADQIRRACMIAELIVQHAEPVERVGVPGLARPGAPDTTTRPHPGAPTGGVQWRFSGHYAWRERVSAEEGDALRFILRLHRQNEARGRGRDVDARNRPATG